MFYLVILNVVLVLFFAEDFNLFSCAFVSLTIALSSFMKQIIIFSKIVETTVNSMPSSFFSLILFICPTNSICWIAFESSSISFFLLK